LFMQPSKKSTLHFSLNQYHHTAIINLTDSTRPDNYNRTILFSVNNHSTPSTRAPALPDQTHRPSKSR
jgi:hypothetical protein